MKGALERFLVAIVGTILRRPFAGVAAALGLLLAFGLGLPRLRFDNSVDAFFLAGDETLATYAEFRKVYASDEAVVVLLDHQAPWTEATIDKVRGLVAALEAIPNVLEVTSITNVRHISAEGDDLDVGDYIDKDKKYTPDELAKLREEARTHPHYSGFFISKDGRYLGVWAKTRIIEGDIQYKIALSEAVRKLIAEPAYADLKPTAVGAPLIDSDVRLIAERESGFFGALVFVFVAIGFFIVFRSAAGVAVPMIVALISIACTFGVLGWLGATINILTPIIPSFIIAVGVGPATYLMTEIYQNQKAMPSLEENTRHALLTAGMGSTISVLTTAGGLLAFASSKIRPVQEVGLGMGIGLLVAFVMTLLIAPVFFGRMKSLGSSKKREEILEGRVELLGRVAAVVLERWKTILVVFTVIGVVAGAGALRLRADYYYQGLFKEDSRIRVDYDTVDAALSGTSTIEVLVRTGKKQGAVDAAVLQKIESFQREMEARHGAIGIKTYSIVDVLKEINQALSGGGKDAYKLPASSEAIAQALFLYEESGDEELTKLVTSGYEEARITISAKSLADSAYEPVFTDLGAFSQTMASSGADVVVTGLRHMWSRINHYLGQSQLQALMICACFVGLALMFVFRSVVLGLSMTIVNAFAILVTLGVMGWWGIVLDPYTILIASIALGILDDDTIHNVKRVLWERDNGKTLRQAIHSAHETVGQAMFYTASTMALAFSCYLFSEMASLAKFGLLVAMTIIIGAIVDFFLTPAVLLGLESVGLLKFAKTTR